MIDDAKLIHSKLIGMRQEQIELLDNKDDPNVSSLKHKYWCHIIGSHLKLIECTTKNSRIGESNVNAVHQAYEELTKAIDLIKKKTANTSQWDIEYKIRILFLKAHQDFIAGNVNTAKSQLFQTHSYYKNKSKDKDKKKNHKKRNKLYRKPNEESIAFLNNMSCIYAINDECGSAMSLIHKALQLHASFWDKSPLYAADHMISYLCYNAGLYLQNLKQYSRAIDSFLCCLPVLQSKPRIWLRMAQCILAIWEPYGGFQNNKDNQPQINSLIQDIVEADSTKRGDLYLLPIGKKPLIYNNVILTHKHDNDDQITLNGNPNSNNDDHNMKEISHILSFHERKDGDYSFPYTLYKQKEKENEIKRKKRWKKRKEKQTEFCIKTDAIIHELDKQQINNNKKRGNKTQNHEHKENKEQERINKIRKNRLYQKEKLRQKKQEKDDKQEYELQMRELGDMKLAVEWLKNAISLYKKMESKLRIADHQGHMSAHIHISYCYLKLKAWNFAHKHAEQALVIHNKDIQQRSSRNPTSTICPSSHVTYLARMYAAEALLNLPLKVNAAMKLIDPGHFPHLTNKQDQSQAHTPKSSKSAKSFRSKEAEYEAKNNNSHSKLSKNKSNRNEYKEKYRERMENEQEKKENDQYLSILVNSATAYICKDQLKNAHSYIHKALTINDEYYPALRMLIYLHMRMGNNNEAIKIIKFRRPIPVQQFMQQNESYN